MAGCCLKLEPIQIQQLLGVDTNETISKVSFTVVKIDTKVVDWL